MSPSFRASEALGAGLSYHEEGYDATQAQVQRQAPRIHLLPGHPVNKDMKMDRKPDLGCSGTLTALHCENALECMKTCDVALSLFCRGVLQCDVGCCRRLSCAIVLPLHLGRHEMAWGAQ